MSPVASIEYHTGADTVGTLRVHNPGEKEGGPYAWACTVVMRGKEARLYGAVGSPTPSQWRAIMDACGSAGATKVTWERRTPRGIRQIVWEL